MRAVNLLPRDAERSGAEGKRAPLLAAAGGVAAVTAAAVAVSISASGAADDRRAELAAVEQSIALVPRSGRRDAVTQAALVQERTDRVAALAAALSTRIPFDRLLRELSFVLPEDAWLMGITASAPASTAPTGIAPGGTPPPSSTASQGVTIQGATYSHESVARVLARVSVIPSLENVRLTASARVEPQADETQGVKQIKKKKKKGKPVVTFTVSATLRTGSSS